MEPIPTISVDVQKPTTISAIHTVILPPVIQINDAARLRLETVVVFDQFGAPIASGREPKVSHYPISAQGFYVTQVLVSTKWPAVVNGSTSTWVDLGSRVVFQTPDVYDFRNGTRLKLAGWAGLEYTEEEFALAIERVASRSITLTPKYRTQYRVWVKPPAYVAQPPNATWADRDSEIVVTIPTPISESAGVRIVLRQWVINGVPGPVEIPLRAKVDKPLNITYLTKVQYLATFVTRYGQAPPAVWADAGSAIAAVPTPTEAWDPPSAAIRLHRLAGHNRRSCLHIPSDADS